MSPSIPKKAISVGLSAALLAALVAAAAAPAALASVAVTSAGVVPVGGTSTSPATFEFCENTAGNWIHGPGTISVTITDANKLSTLTFTNATGGTAAPTLPLNPGGLGGVTILSVVGGTVTVNVPTDDGVNALCFSIGNLYITASSTAAVGAINATSGGTISAGTYAATTTSAAGVLSISYAAGLTSMVVNLTSTCPFVNVGTAPGPAGDFIIAGNDGGSTGVASAVGVPAAAQQTLTGFTAFTVGVPAGGTVTQANVPNCSASSLASPGTVGAAVTETATTKNVNPGQQNQSAGNVTAVESAAAVIPVGTLTFSISAPSTGVTFSTAPTITAGGTSVAVAPPTGLAGTVIANGTGAHAYGTVAAGTYYFEITATGTAGETLPSAFMSATVGTGGGAVVLNWTGVVGATGYKVYVETSPAGPWALQATVAVPTTTTLTWSVPWAAGALPPTSNTTAPLISAPTGLTASGETNVAGTTGGAVAIGTYYFEVTAKGSTSGETTPSAVAGPFAVTVAATDAISLSWTAPSGVSGYNVYASTAATGPFGLVASPVAATALLDTVTIGATAPPTTNTAVGTSTGSIVLGSTLCTLNFGAQSCSVTVTTASASPATLVLANIWLDVAGSVPAGTAVDITITSSPAIIVNVSSNTIAWVGRTIASVGAQPTIFIGYNGQNGGMITLQEAGPAFFQSSGVNDAFGICINTHETFTYAPWAIVAAPATGGVLLLNTANSTGVTQIAGTLYSPLTGPNVGKSCAMWSIYAVSTVASTIDIVGATSNTAPLAIGATNGPTLSVPQTLTPGTTQMDVLVGAQADVALDNANAIATIASDATRVYKSGITVTAVSQPVIAPGSDPLGGNLVLAETLNGQFLAGEIICVAVLPRSSNFFVQDTTINTANSGMLPVISTNYGTTGLLASSVATPKCPVPSDSNYSALETAYPQFVLNAANSFYFTITQQATNGLGQITISNINYITTADAPNGPIQVAVFSENATALNQTGGVPFEEIVSNGIIGTVTSEFLSADSATGVTHSGPFSISTKTTKKGTYVTIRIQSSPALAGKDFGIYIAKDVSGVWTKFSPHTGRVANGQGVVYYYYKAGSVAHLSIRGFFAGDAMHTAAWSPAVQVQFTK